MLPPELLSELKEGCEWKRADFTLFDQKNQRLKFRYQKCSSTPHIGFDIVGYNEVQTESGLPLLVIGKQGPYKPKEHMAAMIPRSTLEARCYAVETPESLWFLLPLNDLQGWTTNEFPRMGPCGSYQGSTNAKGWVFAFNEGIVFGFFQEGVKNFIDLSSVKYENNG